MPPSMVYFICCVLPLTSSDLLYFELTFAALGSQGKFWGIPGWILKIDHIKVPQKYSKYSLLSTP